MMVLLCGYLMVSLLATLVVYAACSKSKDIDG